MSNIIIIKIGYIKVYWLTLIRLLQIKTPYNKIIS